MKKRLAAGFIILLTALFGIAFVTFAFGVLFDCEYMYYFTIKAASGAKTINGESANEVIARRLQISEDNVDYHRCAYCSSLEDGFPEGTIRVQIAYDKSINYVFAYDESNNVLYPADRNTAAKFSSMGPSVVVETKKLQKSLCQIKITNNNRIYEYDGNKLIGRHEDRIKRKIKRKW